MKNSILFLLLSVVFQFCTTGRDAAEMVAVAPIYVYAEKHDTVFLSDTIIVLPDTFEQSAQVFSDWFAMPEPKDTVFKVRRDTVFRVRTVVKTRDVAVPVTDTVFVNVPAAPSVETSTDKIAWLPALLAALLAIVLYFKRPKNGD